MITAFLDQLASNEVVDLLRILAEIWIYLFLSQDCVGDFNIAITDLSKDMMTKVISEVTELKLR